MKVIEKGTDRSANVHLLRHQRVPPLDEYGELVNSDDKAIECFVAVEEGQQIKIGGRFSGTTMVVGYDVIIDGVCRKHHTYHGKQVTLQKNKKLDAEQFLFKTSSGEIVDTELLVAKIPADIVKEEGARGLGTIEVRVYVLRRFGDEHALQGIEPYYAVKEEGHTSHAVDGNNFDKTVGFTNVPPEFIMTYQKNVAALEGNIVKRVKTKMDKQRPGAEPWAIFRFHFRNKQSILDKGFKTTFDSSKGKQKKYQELQIEELPMLPVGAAPKKDSSSLATPAPSTAPSTPVKEQERGEYLPTVLCTLLLKICVQHDTAKANETNETANGYADDKSSDNGMPTHNNAGLPNGAKATNGFTPKLPFPQGQKPTDITNGTTHKSLAPQFEKPAELTNGTTTKVPAKEVQKSALQVKKGTVPSAPPSTTKKDPVTPAKRPAALNSPRSPEIKRTKLSSTPGPASRVSSSAPSNKDRLLFTQLAEARKRAQEIKAKRVATAQKQSNVDEQLSPYQQRIQDEIDKLNDEAEQEALQHEEDEKRLKDSIRWLKELQSGDMEV
ncbi:hypothetical protein K505DRAFT_390444 [Melanomma pulvis-pyrius CBS 109.77]|uniref:Uncharacterized protein n=1 Tax=Melanomma pulvis-pyrius CBS 109.77 TaxID=1314802 RepID=A0A6A6X309_9PLEO|nr:hypothetical protein K505DRAFT_390444 [Melanomma pulvis-pyrius CBS 109.77]